jgi:hypothetical protein
MCGHRGSDWREGDGSGIDRASLPLESKEAAQEPEEAMTDISLSDRATKAARFNITLRDWLLIVLTGSIAAWALMLALIGFGVELARALLP